MHKWRPKKYSFVFVLISLTSLVSTDKIQKKSCFRTRLVGLISTKPKECFFWPPFMHSVYCHPWKGAYLQSNEVKYIVHPFPSKLLRTYFIPPIRSSPNTTPETTFRIKNVAFPPRLCRVVIFTIHIWEAHTARVITLQVIKLVNSIYRLLHVKSLISFLFTSF